MRLSDVDMLTANTRHNSGSWISNPNFTSILKGVSNINLSLILAIQRQTKTLQWTVIAKIADSTSRQGINWRTTFDRNIRSKWTKSWHDIRVLGNTKFRKHIIELRSFYIINSLTTVDENLAGPVFVDCVTSFGQLRLQLQ